MELNMNSICFVGIKNGAIKLHKHTSMSIKVYGPSENNLNGVGTQTHTHTQRIQKKPRGEKREEKK